MRDYKSSDFWVEFIATIIFVAIMVLTVLFAKNAEKRSEKRTDGLIRQTLVSQKKYWIHRMFLFDRKI